MVYVIEAKDAGQVKIGCTRHDPVVRMAAIQRGVQERLSLRCVIDGDYATEKMLHNILADKRVSGEWFTDGPHIADALNMVQVDGGLNPAGEDGTMAGLLIGIRDRAGVSQAAAAVYAGCSPMTWRSVERGLRAPTMDEIGGLLRGCGATHAERVAVTDIFMRAVHSTVSTWLSQEVTR